MRINMLVEHFMGQKECNNLEELREVLGERTEKGVNEFIISTNEQFPYMIMSVKGKYACLSYFRGEDGPGYSSVNDTPVLDADGISIFYTNTDSEEIEVANYSIIEIEDAVSAVEEFFETLQLPKCIEWEEL